MEWILILTAVNTLNSNDIPAKLVMEFPTKELCEKSASTIKYEIDFKWYKLDKQCKRKNS
jgi:hypothetical protein